MVEPLSILTGKNYTVQIYMYQCVFFMTTHSALHIHCLPSLRCAFSCAIGSHTIAFNTRHADREAEPKNYDVTKSDIDDRDLLRATYDRIGNITDGVSLISTESELQVHDVLRGHFHRA